MRNSLKYLSLMVLFGMGVSCSQSGAEAQQISGAAATSEVISNWTVDKSASSISFTGVMSGDAFTGSFADFDAQIRFDPENLDAAKINVTVAMAGADASDPERTEALPGKEWFSIKKFPNAVFASETVNKTDDDQYEAIGELAIKGVTKPLTLPFSLEVTDQIAHAKAQISINRTDFGIGTGMWKSEEWVAHNVDIEIVIKADRN